MHRSNAAAPAERKHPDSPSADTSVTPTKRVILTMGGKGGSRRMVRNPPDSGDAP